LVGGSSHHGHCSWYVASTDPTRFLLLLLLLRGVMCPPGRDFGQSPFTFPEILMAADRTVG